MEMKRAAALVASAFLFAAGCGHSSRAPSPSTPSTPAPSPPAPAPPTPAPEQFGASVNLLFNGRLISGPRLDGQLAALRQTGATLARSDAPWEVSEPAPPRHGVHRYDWGFDDRIASSLAAHGLRWLPIIDYSAPWAQSLPGHDHSAPTSDADYAAYAAAVAARYGEGGLFWRSNPKLRSLPVRELEIWNEPDNGLFWAPAPNAARYAQLYATAHDAIHAVDPSALVLVGGLSNAPAFLSAMLSSDPALRGLIDAVAIHPYAATPAAVLGRVVEARHALGSLGLGNVPLYVTEFGWTTSPPGALDWLPASRRPGYIQTTLADLSHSGCGVAAAVLYTWFSPGRNRADSQDWFGISGSSTDVDAFAAGIRQAGGTPPQPSIACAS
jgi:hypothetical protein